MLSRPRAPVRVPPPGGAAKAWPPPPRVGCFARLHEREQTERSFKMERERQIVRPAGGGGGPDGGADLLDQVRADAAGILDAADRILDSIRPLTAEDYLQQTRQRGGQ